MTRLKFAAKTGDWRKLADKRDSRGNVFARYGNLANVNEQATPSSTERYLQIQYRYPSPLKRSVRLGRPLFSVPPHFLSLRAVACPPTTTMLKRFA